MLSNHIAPLFGLDVKEKAHITAKAWMLVAIAISIGASGGFARTLDWFVPVAWMLVMFICVAKMLKAEADGGYWDEPERIERNPATHQGAGI